MGEMNKLLFYFGFLAVRSAEGLFSNFKLTPTCRNRTSDFDLIELDVQLTPRPIFRPENDTFDLFIEAEWTVLYGEGIPIDGFAVHFMKVAEKRNFTIPNHSISPVSPCMSGSDHIWLQATDQNVGDFHWKVTECGDKYPEFFLCPLSNCTLLPNPLRCRGTPDLMRGRDVFYQTVPSTTTKLRYPAEFHMKYEFAVTPYYRQFANADVTTARTEVDDCAGLLENVTENRNAAHALCCGKGAKNIFAYNVTAAESRPHFEKFANETSFNVTLSWLPPRDESHESFRVNLVPHDETAQGVFPEWTSVTKKFIGSDSAETNDSECSFKLPSYSYEIEAYNLVSGRRYVLMIMPIFSNGEIAHWCNQARCQTEFTFVAKEPANLCLAEFGLCDAHATCVEELDRFTGRNATCECGVGWVGDGLNADIGGGCSDVDGCAFGNECSDFAECEDLHSPKLGANCTCKEGYYGDGRLSGSGCSSKTVIALAVSLPVVALFIIASVVVAVCLAKRRRMIKEKIASQFVVDADNGVLAAYLNPTTGEREVCSYDPTFGSEWEIDLSNIRFGPVLGRGNYGIVHLAWVSEGSERTDSGGIARNKTKEKCDDKLDADEIVVAVKHLQESMRNHQNLKIFLAEIGFMLNIGHHENIARVYGCSTTKEPVCLVTEYLCYGDLLHFLWDAREPSRGDNDPIYRVTDLSLCAMARHVAKGMSYLHRMRFIHGDIAARNILVGDDGICKLADFGLANDVYKYSVIEGHREILVPLKWSSPERLMSGQVPITSKSDVWSYGNLLYEMFTLGCPPHPGVPSTELLARLRSGYRMKKPNTCSDQIYEMMNKCWRWRASSRLTFAQLIKILDTMIDQLQSSGLQVNMASAVEELDREQYVKEFMTGPGGKENDYVNGAVTVVENERLRQTREM